MQSATSNGEASMAAYIDARSALPGAPVVSAAGLIARIWRGRTLAVRADDYAKYLYDEGVCAIARIPGNRGVQMLRRVDGDMADFQVISYWDSVEAIKRFAGDKYEEVHHLPDDPKYMIGAAPTVEHFEVVVNNWTQR
jgi:heme-degrading monooxygenase HmoA